MILIVDKLRFFLFKKHFNKKKDIKIYFIFKSKFHNIYLFLLKTIGYRVEILQWDFLEIKNNEGFNKFFDLEFFNMYKVFEKFKSKDKFFENYLLKNILKEEIDLDKFKPIWSIYLADVISYKFSQSFNQKIEVYLPNNNLNKFIKDYYYKKKIEIHFVKKFFFKRIISDLKLYFKIIFKRNYYFLKNSKIKSKKNEQNSKICFEFAYIQNKINDLISLKNFPINNYLFCERSLKDLNTINEQLLKTKIHNNFYYLIKPSKKNLLGKYFNEITEVNQKNNNIIFNNLYEKIKFKEFILEKNLWKSFFKKTNTKVYVTSYYSDYQVAAAKAISELGGCTIFIQLSFYDRPGLEVIPSSDVYFYLTKKENFNEKRILLYNKFFVKTGFLNDFNFKLYREKSLILKENLKKNGAKKIIGYFDQGYKKDKRWNHGYQVSCKNYKFFLEKVIKYPWLGLILKPKIASEIRLKLKSINHLLEKAIKTGRCIVIDEGTDSHKKNFDLPPPLISSACDISIHDSLVSATAGMESISAGNHVLFFDDTGFKNSTISKIEKNIVYDDLENMWNDISNYFFGKKEIQNLFEDISNFINSDKKNESINKKLKFCSELNSELNFGKDDKYQILNKLINKNFKNS